MPANRRQRRPQLVGDGHEEVAGQLLRLRQPRRHLAEPRREPLDLAASTRPRQLNVVLPGGDLVGGARERLERPGDAPREERDEENRERDAG